MAVRSGADLLAHCLVMDGHAETIIDLDAIKDNVTALRRHVGGAAVMAVVKSDAYGHGMVPAARAALAGGASWIGVITVPEALALRRAGVSAPVLCLMGVPGTAHEEAVRQRVDLSAGTVSLVMEIAAAATLAGRPARLHLKADTGMSRGGATARDWPGLVDAALAAEAAGDVEIIGVWSHMACADMPGHPSIDTQAAAFRDAVALAEKAGAKPELRHLANTPATLTLPQAWFDMVRTGGGVYGLSTLPGGPPDWLRPAMTVRTRLIQVKQVAAGAGVSYGHRYITPSPATLGLVPIGYAEGVPRGASGLAEVHVRGLRRPISGTVCMNQFVVDFGEEAAQVGDEVVLLGTQDGGRVGAEELGSQSGTINYEITTGINPRRVERSHRDVRRT